MDQQLIKIAGLILNCEPGELRGHSMRTDGSLAVIAPNGMKFIFSPVELENARDSFGLPPFIADMPSVPTDSSPAILTDSSLAEPVEATPDNRIQPNGNNPMKPRAFRKSRRAGSRV